MAGNVPQRLDDGLGAVLVALADPAERESARTWLAEAGYEVLVAEDPLRAATLVRERLDVEVAVVDHQLCTGRPSLLEAVLEAPSGLELVLAGPADVFVVTQGIAAGARSFLPHPLTQQDLLQQVAVALHAARRALVEESLALRLPERVEFEGIVGATPRMVEVIETLRKAAPTDAPVVILGETGTGKELIARAIHQNSRRRAGPFVALHLLATPAGLVESELFGHKRGSFTSAVGDRTGKLELAHGGTMFFDELGDVPLETQAKLLRVLETKTFEPVGANRTVTSDFRVIAATNQDIETMIKEKRFRPELWQRLAVVKVEVPPLRERRADIPALVERFIREAATRYGKPVAGIEPEALAALARHHWRGGNIRELRNKVDRMVVLCEGERIALRDVPREVRAEGEEEGSDLVGLAGRSMDEIEREAIKQTLKLTQGNRKAAAQMLQIGERTLYRKIERYGL